MDSHEKEPEQPVDPVAELTRDIQEHFKRLGIQQPQLPKDENMPDDNNM